MGVALKVRERGVGRSKYRWFHWGTLLGIQDDGGCLRYS